MHINSLPKVILTFGRFEDRGAGHARGLRARRRCSLHGGAPLFPALVQEVPLVGARGFPHPAPGGVQVGAS
eukprot:11766404-Alexandrium_andersonii.AAC.1